LIHIITDGILHNLLKFLRTEFNIYIRYNCLTKQHSKFDRQSIMMAKGKTDKTDKIKSSTQKSTEQQKTAPTTKPATITRSNKTDKLVTSQSRDISSCGGCGVIITDDVQALQCEKGSNCKMWKCAACLNISQELYEQLTSEEGARLRWFCDQCAKKLLMKVPRIKLCVTEWKHYWIKWKTS